MSTRPKLLFLEFSDFLSSTMKQSRLLIVVYIDYLYFNHTRWWWRQPLCQRFYQHHGFFSACVQPHTKQRTHTGPCFHFEFKYCFYLFWGHFYLCSKLFFFICLSLYLLFARWSQLKMIFLDLHLVNFLLFALYVLNALVFFCEALDLYLLEENIIKPWDHKHNNKGIIGNKNAIRNRRKHCY